MGYLLESPHQCALFSKCPSELGLELGSGGARLGVAGLDELENGRNKRFCITLLQLMLSFDVFITGKT